MKGEAGCGKKLKDTAKLVIGGSVFAALCGLVAIGNPGIGELGRFMHGSAVYALYSSGWGLATGVGLWQRWRWARISMLIFSGILVAIGVFVVIGLLLMPRGNAAWWQAVIVMAIGLSIYLIPIAVGVRWLIFFTRRNVKAEFAKPFRQETTTQISP